MNKLLYLPGLLFLLVIFFRVILPLIKQPAWKRLLDSARYERHQKNNEKSDKLLTRALHTYPDRPEVALEYYLNHSDSTDLKNRFEILKNSWEKTQSPPLAFFLGSAFLEEGDLEEAGKILTRDDVKAYMESKRIGLLVQYWYELGEYDKAEEQYFSAFNGSGQSREKFLEGTTAMDLLPLVMIKKARGGDWKKLMDLVPRSSIHTDMSWKDCLAGLKEQKSEIKPAVTGIYGDPGNFNRRRRLFFEERIALIESYL